MDGFWNAVRWWTWGGKQRGYDSPRARITIGSESAMAGSADRPGIPWFNKDGPSSVKSTMSLLFGGHRVRREELSEASVA